MLIATASYLLLGRFAQGSVKSFSEAINSLRIKAEVSEKEIESQHQLDVLCWAMDVFTRNSEMRPETGVGSNASRKFVRVSRAASAHVQRRSWDDGSSDKRCG